jgi:threonine dehydrogenase-like Zn-dependent dehydrogenase
MTGGYPGGQAEFVRVPFSDVGPLVLPDHLEDEQVLFLTDILSTGWMAADQATIEPGDTVVVWGAGPVGLFAAQSAKVMGAEQVIVIDHYPGRLALARSMGAKVIDFSQTNVLEALMEMTGGQGPDAVIDAVGMESHGFANFNPIDTLKQKVGIGVDRIGALRQAIFAVRKGGRVSVPGVYGGFSDKFPTGALMEKGLTLRTGQTHVQRYHRELLRRIEEGQIDTTFLISHFMSLEDAAAGYANFAFNQNDWTKVVLKPGWEKGREQAGPARAIIAQRGEVGATGRQGALERA